MNPIDERDVFGQPAWEFESPSVKVSMTRAGGMTAPVLFRHNHGEIDPYYTNPWHAEKRELDVPVLVPLRGDFFCLPFGVDNDVGDEAHTVHGEAASAEWRFLDLERRGSVVDARFAIDYGACAGRLEKRISLDDATPAMYIEHVAAGFSGAYPAGHHATLRGGDDDGLLRISVKPFDFGLTADAPTRAYADGEYASILAGERFTSLAGVKTIWKDPTETDISRFPARRGFCDVVALYRRIDAAAAERDRVAWTCAVNASEGWAWFSLKDASVLPATIFWMENNGRRQAPWNGRNSCIGLEEVCGYGAYGRAASIKPNRATAQGVPTAIDLKSDEDVMIRTIQGAVPIPSGFARVETVELQSGGIVLRGGGHTSVEVPVKWRFLFEGLSDAQQG